MILKIVIVLSLFVFNSHLSSSQVESATSDKDLQKIVTLDERNGRVQKIRIYRDTSMIYQQLFIGGKLYKSIFFDSEQQVKEEIYFYGNGKKSEHNLYESEELMKKQTLYKRSGKTDIVYFYEEGKLLRYVEHKRNGEPSGNR